MSLFLTALILACICALSLFAAGHALLTKRDSRAALGWMTFNLTVPVIGPFVYWCLGVNRISRRARRWSKERRIVSGTDLHPYDEKEVVSDELPDSFAHLRELRVLGDRIVRAHLRAGNSIKPLMDADEAYPAMLDAIRSARHNINLCSYIFDGDGVGADFVVELRKAAERGVEVRVIIDAMGEKYSSVKARKVLARSAVQFRVFLPFRHGFYINLRNHRKLLIIDGTDAFTGGMNIRSNHFPLLTTQQYHFHDMHFSVNGPVVSDLQRVFIEDWHFVTGEKLDGVTFFPEIKSQGDAISRCVADGPDRIYRKLELIIMGALSSAEKSVYIMTPYFVPDRSMMAALITTTLRGVTVNIVLPEKNNLPFVHWANRAILSELIAIGVRVYYQPAPFVHTKLMLMDDIWSLIGSANFDARSLRLNFELNLTVFDRLLAAELQTHFDRVMQNSRLITIDELRQRSLPVKLMDNFARLFSPYL
jgi:cardiolipin synthase A/B